MTGTTDAQQRARAIRLLLLDVDGVLSDGGIVYDSEGRELKRFHIHDGLGIKLLQQHGIHVGIITGRVSPMVERRAKELGIELLIQGREDKAHAMHEAMAQLSLTLDAVAYMGDDLPDLAAITQAGLGIAPANAVNIVRQHADLVTIASGGHGAVREAAELILAAQGQLDTLHARYIQH
ncbi:MAG: HAD hydrolase family protein [Pseudomonadales bacterium]|jgi:3-deoxy-D-manno-octulosonate 8-phosphate phosphatase (KDO 8-P phosphatase)